MSSNKEKGFFEMGSHSSDRLKQGVKRREFEFGDCGSDAGSRPENDRIGSLLLHYRKMKGGRPLRRRRKLNQTTPTATATATADLRPCDVQPINVEAPQSVHSFPIELGMEFESDEHAISYYNKYAVSIGFSTRKEYVNRKNGDKSSYVTSRKISCYKEGHRKRDKRDVFVKKPRKVTRTGCLAHVVISRVQSNGRYRITSFVAEHNHPLAPKGTEHMLPSQRKIYKVKTPKESLADGCGIPSKSPHGFMTRQTSRRAYLGYANRDQRSNLHSKRQRNMKLGEASGMLHYFEERRLEDPSFFFDIQFDAEDSITNVFWADAKMIVDHKFFGDVVSFDTTYKTNANRPFVLFAGMNHYKKMVIFGAALMYDETVESYKWVFETFLEAMSGRKPKTVLTDQDASISKAVSLAMPEAYHRLCVWHMGQNALKHLNHAFRGSDSFGKDFYRCIYQFEEESEFLNAWEVMLDKYDLRDNDWLRSIFALREKWAMVYGRDAFSAGMRSTQLSKSFNNFMKDYLKSDIDLLHFFIQFEKAVDNNRYKELEASYDMTQRIPRLKVDLPLLHHARDMYTSVIFEMFQDEWTKSLLVVVNSWMEDGPCCVYKVSTPANIQEHIVVAKPSDVIVSCSCKKFESLGILCSHALKILDMMNVKLMIPGHYILKRWTKDARVGSVEVVDTEEDAALQARNRYRSLFPTFVQIVASASESKAGYELAAKYANKLAVKLEAIYKEENCNGAPAAPTTTAI